MANIIEKYIETNGQLIIAISGFSGIGKNKIAKQLSKDTKLEVISLANYAKKDYMNIIELTSGTKINNHDNFNYYDWDKFNKDVNDKKRNGLIIIGIGFPNDNLEFKIDYHIMVRAPKQLLFEFRHNYIVKHKDKLGDLLKIIDTPDEKQLVNSITYPFYLNIPQISKIDKFYNITKMDEEIYDDLYDNVIKFIMKNVYNNRSDIRWNENTNDFEYVSQ